jgi:hypothetical protein
MTQVIFPPRAVAVASFRGKHFTGYAVRGPKGWICVALLGRRWARATCANLNEVKNTLRTVSDAVRFCVLPGVDELNEILARLPAGEAPKVWPDMLLIHAAVA